MLIAASGAAAAAPGSPSLLTDAEWSRLARGEILVVTHAVPGYPWPEVTAHLQMAATPDEVMAVYADFEGQASYLPELVTCRIIRRVAANVFEVFYEYAVSGPNERYTVTIEVGRRASALEATWDLVRARYAKRLSGGLRVEPRGAGALVTYTSRVDPGTLGVYFGSPAIVTRRLEATVTALAARVGRLRADDPERLGDLMARLRAMLESR